MQLGRSPLHHVCLAEIPVHYLLRKISCPWSRKGHNRLHPTLILLPGVFPYSYNIGSIDWGGTEHHTYHKQRRQLFGSRIMTLVPTTWLYDGDYVAYIKIMETNN